MVHIENRFIGEESDEFLDMQQKGCELLKLGKRSVGLVGLVEMKYDHDVENNFMMMLLT